MKASLEHAIASNDRLNNIWQGIGLAGYVGSISHGTAGDIIDDIDVAGVYIAPVNHYFGMTPCDHFCQCDIADDYDFSLYEIRKYISLCFKSNPNVLSLLWLPDNMYIAKNHWGEELIANRSLFMTKQLYKTFGGYAYGQLQRMTRCCTGQAYQGKKRRERYEKYGYDCKNAQNLIRILRQGVEALATGEINVYRHDNKVLKAIKNGEWSLNEVSAEALRLQILLDEALVTSRLPDAPDFDKTERLLIGILQCAISK